MEFIIASHNKGKIAEFKRILEPMGINVITAELTEAEENGASFEENALIKARSACAETGKPSVADDSGLCVDALGGAPGIHTARFAPEGQRKLTMLKKMEDVEDEKRTAYFISVIACVFPNGDEIVCTGKCEGAITREIIGENGFGYDPIFSVNGKTFAQMSAEEKDAISHRGKAFEIFRVKLQEYLNK